ncbi:MAG: hypothetical protein QGI21_01780 [Candidatus Poseidoniaceae archaeon]|jgi:hypothetical protein|nr:hypothetical protein [Candidatus Poseidoniaceae archaeon]
MQPQNDPYGQPYNVMIDPNTGMPSNVIVINQRSSAPLVVGILVIIGGAFGVLGEFYNLAVGTSGILYGGLFAVFTLTSLVLNGGLIVGGAMISKYQKRGIHISLLIVVISAIIGVLSLTMMPDMMDQIADDEGLNEQEREQLVDASGLVAGIGAIMIVVCNGICGLIIAIPLMVSNSGLDDTSLFG